MEYHDDLLQQAWELVHKDPAHPRQANLRRAVSAAYYALFHLLVSESVGNWNRPRLRASLGRAFDHAPMRGASTRLLNLKVYPFTGEDPNVVANLRTVAAAFVQLQDERHVADYDNNTVWMYEEALAQVKIAEGAFFAWNLIRNEEIAQTYLVSFLIKNRV